MQVPSLKVRAAAVAVIAAVAVAGCGSSSDSSTTSGSADFVAQANALCTKSSAEIRAVPQPKSNADTAPYLDKTVPLIESGLAELQDLTPPSEQQAAYDKVIADVGKQADLLVQAQTAADSGDTAKAISLVSQQAADNKSIDTQAAALGLTECLRNADSGSSGSS